MSLDIEGVLTAHVLAHADTYDYCAGCGEEYDYATDEYHRAHVAAVIREQIAAWLTSEAAVVWSGSDTWSTLIALAAPLVAIDDTTTAPPNLSTTEGES